MIGNKFLSVTGGEPSDAQFNYVTMLLRGDGTNGAQNNTFVDSSTNNFTITRNGNTTQGTFSPYGSSWSNYFYSANSDYHTIGSAGNWKFLNDGSTNWTVEFWVNLTDTSSRHEVISTNTNSVGSAYGITCGTNLNNAGDVFLQITNGVDGDGLLATTGAGVLSAGKWGHVAITLDASAKSLKIYVDGVLQATTTRSYTFGNATPSYTMNVGRWVGTVSGVGGYFNGGISNLRIVTSILYSSTFTPSTTALTAVSGTQLLAYQSNRIKDNSSNAYTISLSGTPSVQRFSPFNPTTAYSTATIGGSGYFDGTGDYLTVGSTTSATLPGDFTIEFWAYTPSTSGTQEWFSKEYGVQIFAQNGYWGLAVSSSNSSTYFISGFSTGAYQANAWSHVAFTRSGNNYYFFVNGVQQFTVSSSSTPSLGTTYPWTLGAWSANPATYNVTGYMAGVRIVNGTALYTSGFTPPTTPLTAVANTQFLLNMTNAGIPDSAMMNDLETVGNAQVSTSVKKYGTGSMYFDGSGDYLLTPAKPSLDLGSGNFTIEAWINITGNNSNVSTAVVSKYSSSNTNWMLRLTRSGSTYDGIEFDAEGAAFGGSFAFGYNTWYHVAVVRNGSSLRLYVNGTDVGGGTASFTVAVNAEPIRVGMISYTGYEYYWYGYIDDLRITKGYARYTTTFTPPAQALPNKGS